MKKQIKKHSKLRVKTGDLVKVIAGDAKGNQGKVLRVLIDKNRVVVEGVNMVTKHQKPSANNPEGGILKVEAALHISNIAVIDPVKGVPTRIGRKLNTQGKLVRFAKKSGEEIK